MYVPLTQVEEADDPDQVEALYRDKPRQNAHQFVEPGRRKGQDGGNQDYGRFNSVAARKNRYGKAIGKIAYYITIRSHIVVEQHDEPGAGGGYPVSEWHDD